MVHFGGRNACGLCSSLATCGSSSEQNTSMLGFWPATEKNPTRPVCQCKLKLENGDTYYYVSSNPRPNPTFETQINNLTNSSYRSVTLGTTSQTGRINNLRVWEFETYVYIPDGTSQVNSCIGTQKSKIDRWCVY